MSFRFSVGHAAPEAEVSCRTVSRVLDDEGEISRGTLGRPREVIERLGYRLSSIASPGQSTSYPAPW